MRIAYNSQKIEIPAWDQGCGKHLVGSCMKPQSEQHELLSLEAADARAAVLHSIEPITRGLNKRYLISYRIPISIKKTEYSSPKASRGRSSSS